MKNRATAQNNQSSPEVHFASAEKQNEHLKFNEIGAEVQKIKTEQLGLMTDVFLADKNVTHTFHPDQKWSEQLTIALGYKPDNQLAHTFASNLLYQLTHDLKRPIADLTSYTVKVSPLGTKLYTPNNRLLKLIRPEGMQQCLELTHETKTNIVNILLANHEEEEEKDITPAEKTEFLEEKENILDPDAIADGYQLQVINNQYCITDPDGDIVVAEDKTESYHHNVGGIRLTSQQLAHIKAYNLSRSLDA